ncbi:hypothetical protein MPER_08967, partial [Moniliophthora perniciosa FA553]
GSVVQLTENFRLNPDLGEFISTIYSRAFIPQKFQPRQLANTLKFVSNDAGDSFGLANGVVERVRTFLLALSNVMLKQHQSFLSQPPVAYNSKDITHIDEAFRPISLTLLRLGVRSRLDEEISYEMHVKAEATLAAALVCSLQRCSPAEDIFVATPHRVQRHAVRAMLQKTKEAQSIDEAFGKLQLGRKGKVTVDTVERLQGSEAAFVICLFSLSSSEPADLKFLLERRRLNVAISRAKTLCILISSSEVLRPSVDILADEGSAKGYAFLKAYEDRAWSA